LNVRDRGAREADGGGIRLRADLAVWAALMALLGLSLWSAYLPLGWMNTPVGLAIAGIKAGLVGTMFMGLARARPLLRLAAAAGFFWVAILFGLTLSDLLTRPWWPS
jgi:cytochrome c oxidase subunit 4